jgi:hypothetical protein
MPVENSAKSRAFSSLWVEVKTLQTGLHQARSLTRARARARLCVYRKINTYERLFPAPICTLFSVICYFGILNYVSDVPVV